MCTMTSGLAGSALLWAILIWTFIVIRVVTGHDHLHLSSQVYGIVLLGIGFGLAVVGHWISRAMR